MFVVCTLWNTLIFFMTAFELKHFSLQIFQQVILFMLSGMHMFIELI